VILATVAVGAIVMTACNGNDDEVSTSGTTTTSSSTTTTAPCAVSGASTDSKSGAGPDTVALLTNVRSGRQPCADRIVFDFRDGAAPAYTVEYEPGPFTIGESGMPVTIDGSAFLVVRFPHASGVDLSDPSATQTYTGPESIHPSGLTHVREIRRIEDFEAVSVWVIGLDAMQPFAVGQLTGPPRVYIDVG